MSSTNFDQSIALVLAHEGGYVNHPKDPGGPTNMGITQRIYDAWRKKEWKPLQSVQLITEDEAKTIYHEQYWNQIHGDELPAGIDYAVCDYAVNSGPAKAMEDLQIILSVPADGKYGLITASALKDACAADEQGLIASYCDQRMKFLHKLSTFSTFGSGWTRRVEGSQAGAQDGDDGVVDLAAKMARGEPYVAPTAIGSRPGEAQTAKASPADVAASHTPEGKGSMLAGLGTAGTIGTVCANAISQTGDNSEKAMNGALKVTKIAKPFLDTIGGEAVILICAVLILCGVGYWLYAQWKRKNNLTGGTVKAHVVDLPFGIRITTGN